MPHPVGALSFYDATEAPSGERAHTVGARVGETALNHLPPKLIRTYDRNTYAAEKRAALDLWAAHLAVAVAQASRANVTRLVKN